MDERGVPWPPLLSFSLLEVLKHPPNGLLRRLVIYDESERSCEVTGVSISLLILMRGGGQGSHDMVACTDLQKNVA